MCEVSTENEGASWRGNSTILLESYCHDVMTLVNTDFIKTLVLRSFSIGRVQRLLHLEILLSLFVWRRRRKRPRDAWRPPRSPLSETTPWLATPRWDLPLKQIHLTIPLVKYSSSNMYISHCEEKWCKSTFISFEVY